MCLYPKLIKNPKYRSTKKNGGVIPAINDERVKYVPIGCTNCMECRKQKAREWQIRLLEDIKTNTNGKFITLTLSNKSYTELSLEITKLDGYNRDNAIITLAVRRFLERWRKQHKRSVRHWLVSELGHNGTENIHLHGIIWTDHTPDEIEKHWQYGYVWKGKRTHVINKMGNLQYEIQNYINAKTVNYITKYVSKMDVKHQTYKSIILTSAGIGSNYTNTYNSRLNKYKDKETIETYRTTSGHKIAMPIYWRNKIYTEQEREKLWLNRLDKHERWVCGERISVKNGDKRYFKLLEFHQKRNISLGYGTDEKNWQKQQYERDKRNLKHKERIAKYTWTIYKNRDPDTWKIYKYKRETRSQAKEAMTNIKSLKGYHHNNKFPAKRRASHRALD
jgi:hypothetical protein